MFANLLTKIYFNASVLLPFLCIFDKATGVKTPLVNPIRAWFQLRKAGLGPVSEGDLSQAHRQGITGWRDVGMIVGNAGTWCILQDERT